MNQAAIGFRAPLPEELAPLFPSYQIRSLIAMGGMGAVYHAIQTSLDREVAIKILPTEFSKDSEFCENFEAEAKAMAKLNHPNLIGIYDFGEVAGMLFIVMEYVPGKSLHEACYGTAIDPAEVIRLMTAISHGLAHAHKYEILHRDIKPANILLDSHLQPKIGDFGLARPLDAQVKEGEAIYGTPGYTAPEVVMPPHKVDQRADIFSLGVLLKELLTGISPESDRRLPSLISKCDPRFDAVVLKATHASPLQRYQNATEVADALQKIASPSGPQVVRAGSPAAPRRPVARKYAKPTSKSGGGGVLVALLVIAGLVAAFRYKDQIFQKAGPNPDPAPVVDDTVKPANPGPVVHEPEPLRRDPGPLVSEPGTVETNPSPVSEPEVVKPEPGPVVSEPIQSSVPGVPPKFDVDSFLEHARSVMATRCGAEIIKHDDALKKNLADFKVEGWKLMQENLTANFHAGGSRELAGFVSQREQNGNRMGEELEKPLKFKKYLVELHQQCKDKETKFDMEMTAALAGHQKTYLYGLGIKLKALQEAKDPGAADLIKAEIEKVNASSDYFAGLMAAANKK
jgi:serine/threonine protein kinase